MPPQLHSTNPRNAHNTLCTTSLHLLGTATLLLLRKVHSRMLCAAQTSFPSCRIVQSSLTRSASTLPTQFLNYTSRGTPAMRFTASMVSAPNFECTGCDMKRHFVLSFYVEDNSLSIAEPPNKETLTGKLFHLSTCLGAELRISISSVVADLCQDS